MTDNEIIKAWKWHISPVHCNGMEIYSAVVECSRELAENTLDLINRQKAEIEELKDILEKVPTNAYDLQVEASEKLENQIKSEAIKEFAEKLKERLTGIGRSTTYGNFEYGTIKSYELDSLVKEMTEVEVNQRKEDEKR